MTYNPGAFLRPRDTSSDFPQAHLIILNQPIKEFELFKRIWSHTNFRICADGGANRLYDMLTGELEEYRSEYLPNLIHGDLDSLRPDAQMYYESRGVRITQDDDQYSTDFAKAMKVLTNGYGTSRTDIGRPNPPSGDGTLDIIILGTLAGRVDQGLGLLHEIYRESMSHRPDSPHPASLWLFSEESVSFLLRAGCNRINGINPKEGIFTPNVGILPIYGPAIISTEGLEWDIKDWKTEMGGMVSTSNHVMGESVMVKTNREVLFTIELKSEKEN